MSPLRTRGVVGPTAPWKLNCKCLCFQCYPSYGNWTLRRHILAIQKTSDFTDGPCSSEVTSEWRCNSIRLYMSSWRVCGKPLWRCCWDNIFWLGERVYLHMLGVEDLYLHLLGEKRLLSLPTGRRIPASALIGRLRFAPSRSGRRGTCAFVYWAKNTCKQRHEEINVGTECLSLTMVGRIETGFLVTAERSIVVTWKHTCKH